MVLHDLVTAIAAGSSVRTGVSPKLHQHIADCLNVTTTHFQVETLLMGDSGWRK
jgi:hypothetical protein